MASRKTKSKAKPAAKKKVTQTKKSPAKVVTKVVTASANAAKDTAAQKSIFSVANLSLALSELVGMFIFTTVFVLIFSTVLKASLNVVQAAGVVALVAFTVYFICKKALLNPLFVLVKWLAKQITGQAAIIHLIGQVLGVMLAFVLVSNVAAPQLPANYDAALDKQYEVEKDASEEEKKQVDQQKEENKKNVKAMLEMKLPVAKAPEKLLVPEDADEDSQKAPEVDDKRVNFVMLAEAIGAAVLIFVAAQILTKRESRKLPQVLVITLAIFVGFVTAALLAQAGAGFLLSAEQSSAGGLVLQNVATLVNPALLLAMSPQTAATWNNHWHQVIVIYVIAPVVGAIVGYYLAKIAQKED